MSTCISVHVIEIVDDNGDILRPVKPITTIFSLLPVTGFELIAYKLKCILEKTYIFIRFMIYLKIFCPIKY